MRSIRQLGALRILALLSVVVFAIHAPVMAYASTVVNPAASISTQAPINTHPVTTGQTNVHHAEGFTGKAAVNSQQAGSGAKPARHCHERYQPGGDTAAEPTVRDKVTSLGECCDGHCPMVLCHLTLNCALAPLPLLAWGGHFSGLNRASLYSSQFLTPLIRPPIRA